MSAIDLIAFVDTETQGLDPAQHRVIEVACALYSVKHAALVECWSALIVDTENPAEAVNRIPAAALAEHGMPREEAFTRLSRMVDCADIWAAHRLEFDAAFLPRFRCPGVCTKFDCEFPRSKIGDHLVNVALAHGVPVHDNHRALTDVMLLVKTFQRVHELIGHDGVQNLLARAMRPKKLFLSLAPFEQKDIVKANGFSFDGATRQWTRRMVPEDAAALPFAVREVRT